MCYLLFTDITSCPKCSFLKYLLFWVFSYLITTHHHDHGARTVLFNLQGSAKTSLLSWILPLSLLPRTNHLSLTLSDNRPITTSISIHTSHSTSSPNSKFNCSRSNRGNNRYITKGFPGSPGTASTAGRVGGRAQLAQRRAQEEWPSGRDSTPTSGVTAAREHAVDSPHNQVHIPATQSNLPETSTPELSLLLSPTTRICLA